MYYERYLLVLSLTWLLVIYYASNVFISLGLTSGTVALLATGVTGCVFFVSTLPAMVSLPRNTVTGDLELTICQAIIDKVGRKPMLLIGSIVMWASMVIVGIIVAKFRHDWVAHATAGWVAVGESLAHSCLHIEDHKRKAILIDSS